MSHEPVTQEELIVRGHLGAEKDKTRRLQAEVTSLRTALAAAVEALEPFAEAFEGMPRWGGLADDWKVWLSIGEDATHISVRVHHIALLVKHFKEAEAALAAAAAVGVKTG